MIRVFSRLAVRQVSRLASYQVHQKKKSPRLDLARLQQRQEWLLVKSERAMTAEDSGDLRRHLTSMLQLHKREMSMNSEQKSLLQRSVVLLNRVQVTQFSPHLLSLQLEVSYHMKRLLQLCASADVRFDHTHFKTQIKAQETFLVAQFA